MSWAKKLYMRMLPLPKKHLTIFAGIFLCGGAIALYLLFYFPDYTRLKKIRQANTRITGEMHLLTKEIRQLQATHEHITQNPAVYEKFAREDLGVVKEGEIVVDIQE